MDPTLLQLLLYERKYRPMALYFSDRPTAPVLRIREEYKVTKFSFLSDYTALYYLVMFDLHVHQDLCMLEGGKCSNKHEVNFVATIGASAEPSSATYSATNYTISLQ